MRNFMDMQRYVALRSPGKFDFFFFFFFFAVLQQHFYVAEGDFYRLHNLATLCNI